MKQSNYDKFLSGFSGRQLLEKHPNLNVSGVWEVRGEDPNCDMGGYHHEPYIGTYTGNLIDVIKFAVEQPHFWSWGGGGSVRAVTVQKINKNSDAIRATIAEKKAAIAQIQAEIDGLEKSLLL